MFFFQCFALPRRLDLVDDQPGSRVVEVQPEKSPLRLPKVIKSHFLQSTRRAGAWINSMKQIKFVKFDETLDKNVSYYLG